MATRQLTQVYLEPAQRKALQGMAKAHGTKMSEEIRNAVEAYLSGVSLDELEMLDVATREAEQHIQAMARDLDETNRKLDAVFAEMQRIRGRRAGDRP